MTGPLQDTRDGRKDQTMTVIRTITLTDEDCTRYIVSGDLSAVVCSTMPGSRSPFLIDYHHAAPQHDGGEAFPCDILGGGACHPEAGCGASELRWAWYQAGCDDEVIWAALERLYAQIGVEG